MLKKGLISLLKSRYFIDFIFTQNDKSIDHIYYVKIDPRKISYISLVGNNPHLSGPEAVCGAFTGCFDLLKVPFEKDFMFKTVEQLLNGKNWQSTIYFEKISKRKGKVEALKHIEKLNTLIKTLSEDGYLSQYEMGRAHLKRRIAQWVVPRHEILIGMDRKGQFFRIRNGRHRLAVAQHIGIQEMPAILTCYHKNAMHLLPPDRKKITKIISGSVSAKVSSEYATP